MNGRGELTQVSSPNMTKSEDTKSHHFILFILKFQTQFVCFGKSATSLGLGLCLSGFRSNKLVIFNVKINLFYRFD